MAEEHDMRPECAKEFGKIEESLRFHEAWRAEISKKIDKVQLEIEKLTGNGNRGKIDELRIMIEQHIARSEAGQQRIDELERRTKHLENRIFSIALQVAAAVGALSLVIHFIIGKIQ